MRTFSDEEFILDNYRLVSGFNVSVIGNEVRCMFVERFTKSLFWRKFWKNSSSKESLPPDFHSDVLKSMIEVMRIDDCVNENDGKYIKNSFQKENDYFKKYLGKKYKKDYLKSFGYFVADTRDDELFNYQGYLNNFKRVILNHSNKTEQYKKNYPKCKNMIFLVCDETNTYVQANSKEDLKKKDDKHLVLENCIPHYGYKDNRFLNVIKQTNADYIIWYYPYKRLLVNGNKIREPEVVIIDVKYIKKVDYKVLDYNDNLIMKVKEEVINESI